MSVWTTTTVKCKWIQICAEIDQSRAQEQSKVHTLAIANKKEGLSQRKEKLSLHSARMLMVASEAHFNCKKKLASFNQLAMILISTDKTQTLQRLMNTFNSKLSDNSIITPKVLALHLRLKVVRASIWFHRWRSRIQIAGKTLWVCILATRESKQRFRQCHSTQKKNCTRKIWKQNKK